MTTDLGISLRLFLVKCDSVILGWIRREIGNIRGGRLNLVDAGGL